MSTAETVYLRFIQALGVVGQAVLAFMVITICYDSLMRYYFKAPTSWSLEINTFLIIYIAVVAAADVQRQDGHIRITFFTDKMGAGTQRVIRTVIGLVGAVFCGIVAWYGGLQMLQAAEYSDRVSSTLGTPMVIPYAMLPIGFGALALQFLLEAFRFGPGSSNPGDEAAIEPPISAERDHGK
jgi:TRAP-type C4-dicarboxylate transport system permease small subunit